MTRGKPSPEQLDLSNELLSLPRDDTFYSQEGIDCRNYGVLGGLEEAKLLLGEILNTDKEHVVVADNSSLALMHDIILFAWLKGMEDSLQPWVEEERTIGPDKLNQLRHVQFLQNKAGILALMKRHRQILAPKFQKINEVFTQILDGTGVVTWTKPKGGYFISVNVLEGCATKCVKLAKEAGITLTAAGATYPYGVDPRNQNIRIAPSYPNLSEISVAAEGIALSILLAVASTLQSKSR